MEEPYDNSIENKIKQTKSVDVSDLDEDNSKEGSPPAVQTTICLVGNCSTDAEVLVAAQGFGFPVVLSEDGSEWLDTTQSQTVFVMDEFSGPIFEKLRKLGHRLLGTTVIKELHERNESIPNNKRPLYSLAMSGLVICFTGFRKKEELARLIVLTHNMGGSIRKDMAGTVTHLIAHKCMGEKYQYALAFSLPVMAASWVHNTWAMRAQVGYSAADPNNNSADKLKLFQGARVCFYGFPEEEEKHMADVLVENGGIHTDIDDPACSHLVLDNAVTFDLIKAGILLPKSRLSLCFPADPLTSTPCDNQDITPVCNRRDSFLSEFSMDIENEDILKKTPKSRYVAETPTSSLTDTLSPIHENPAIGCLTNEPSLSNTINESMFFDTSIKELNIIRKPISFSEKRIFSCRTTSKRRKTMSPNDSFKKRKKSPKETFKTLTSIRRSLRLKTFNSLSRWISTSDITKKSLSPSISRKPLTVHENTQIPEDEPSSSPMSLVTSTMEEDTHRMQSVVDVSPTVTSVPQAPSKSTHIVKAEWFWATVQNEALVPEKQYLFEDHLESLVSPNRNDSDVSLTMSGRRRKRKRFFDTTPRVVSGYNVTPVVSKRRSSVSDAGLLSMSGSFLDCTPSSGGHLSDTEIESINSDTPRKEYGRRYEGFLELYHTETNYVNILNTIMTLFKTPLETKSEEKKEPLLNPTELKIIFGNFSPIYQLHCKMLEKLKWVANHWTDDVSIGKIIVEFAPDLVKAYPPYINFFETTKEMLVMCDQTKPRFHAFLKICQSKPECGRQTLQELLIRPVQRLPSISILLNDLLVHTDKTNPDHSALDQALSKIREVMTHINEDKRRTEGQMAIFDIFNNIEQCPPYIVSSHRNFVSRCDVIELSDGLRRKGDSLSMFLFSDVMEICKKRSKVFDTLKSPRDATAIKLNAPKPFKHIHLMPLSHIKKVIDIKETDDCHKSFALICKSNQDLREERYLFKMVDEDKDKIIFLKTLCRQMANTVCIADAETFLTSLEPQQLDIDTSDVTLGTLGKAIKMAARTRMKVGRAFSFNKTPNKLRRVVSTMMSPFGSTSSLTPATQLEQMRLAADGDRASLNEFATSTNANGSPPAPQYIAPMSVQPMRRNKHASLSVASLRRL
uniref:DH domain-containing protein n=1 Tax=Clastoptera arizonana TaxID=38151 RepID=A0A1B6CSH8_9HEMI